MLREDSLSPSPYVWMNDPFSLQELDMSIASCKINSSPGLDSFDYKIIATLP